MEVPPLPQQVLARLGVQEEYCHHTARALAQTPALALETTLASPATRPQHVRVSKVQWRGGLGELPLQGTALQTPPGVGK